jgi:hypothetical protein
LASRIRLSPDIIRGLVIEDFNVFTGGSRPAAYYDKGTFKKV